MNHRAALVVCLLIASLAGCAGDGSPGGVGTRPGDDDAAVGTRGPRPSGNVESSSSPAPSVEPRDANRENQPVP